jgi:hypothetical protein
LRLVGIHVDGSKYDLLVQCCDCHMDYDTDGDGYGLEPLAARENLVKPQVGP